MFYEKALIVNIILSRSLNTCISRECALQKEGNIFVKWMYHLIRIYLSQFCFKVGGGRGIYFLLCGKLCKQMCVNGKYEMFRQQNESWL